MILMKRLGSAAKLGCQVFLRQPGVIALKKPTPEFWTSVLYKNLVGRGVLEAQIVSNNGSGVNIYSHCNPTISKDKSVLDSGN
ncbi:hypothetical protein O3M35_012724 [Rhynocoris fuscipes]|uniref:Uncharacterized protein n=1 Tax=Rhynocoris fuscipes TaxID=488301 RepID=A0AAW1CWH0_9HEMI